MLYLKECRRIASSAVYLLFIVLLVVNWYQNFAGVTKSEIDWAKGGPAPGFTMERPLLAQPSPEDEVYGSKNVEDPELLMRGAVDTLLREYKENVYATYPFDYYKAVSLDESKQTRILEILCEITGLSPEQLMDLPRGYFPSFNGTTIHFGNNSSASEGSFSIKVGEDDRAENGAFSFKVGGDESGRDSPSDNDVFSPKVSYERFRELMAETESLIGEKGSQYSPDMMVTYFGLTGMSYEEAMEDYRQTIEKDHITGGFARLFCDYMGQALGLYPVFLIVLFWLKDKRGALDEVIYSRQISSAGLVSARCLAVVTMALIPVFLLSFQSLILLVQFGGQQKVDMLAYVKYILWWLLPTLCIVTALGTFLTLLTDTPIAILLQFLWWSVDRGITGLSGDTRIYTLMIRHNTLRGYEAVQQSLQTIWINRLGLLAVSVVLCWVSGMILTQKRKGKLNGKIIYEKLGRTLKEKLGLGHKK